MKTIIFNTTDIQVHLLPSARIHIILNLSTPLSLWPSMISPSYLTRMILILLLLADPSQSQSPIAR
jgi:hypothetical protein